MQVSPVIFSVILGPEARLTTPNISQSVCWVAGRQFELHSVIVEMNEHHYVCILKKSNSWICYDDMTSAPTDVTDVFVKSFHPGDNDELFFRNVVLLGFSTD